MICPVISMINMMAAGVALRPMADAMKSVYELLQRKNQDTLQRILRPFYQLVLNLMGVAPEVDASVLTGTIMNENDDLLFLKQQPPNSSSHCLEIECCLLWCQVMLNFHLHKFIKAHELLEQCRKIFYKYPHVFLASMQINLEFWNAMTAVRLLWGLRKRRQEQEQQEEGGTDSKNSKHNKSKNRLSLAEKKRQDTLLAATTESLQVLQTLSKHSSENVESKVLMVQGNLQALEAMEGPTDESNKSSSLLAMGKASFLRAIEMAASGEQEDQDGISTSNSGYLADKAVFCEHAGLTLRECGEEDLALDYLEDCCTSYREWGASMKVNHVKGTVIPQTTEIDE